MEIGVGREVICLSFFPLLLRLAFVLPGIVLGTQVFVDCVCCVGEACCIKMVHIQTQKKSHLGKGLYGYDFLSSQSKADPGRR
jgi:hypothetical protein